MDITVTARVVRLAPSLFVCMGVVAGITIRGGTRDNAPDAIGSFFEHLAGHSGNRDDATIALAFLATGTDLGTTMAQLGDGS